jgi:hypothetical protein
MEQVKQEINRDVNGRIKKGSASLNPKGRPVGKTLKEFAREMLLTMNDEEKIEYLRTLPKDIVWRMAEGNPHQTQDMTTNGEKLQPVLVEFINGKSKDNSNTN